MEIGADRCLACGEKYRYGDVACFKCGANLSKLVINRRSNEKAKSVSLNSAPLDIPLAPHWPCVSCAAKLSPSPEETESICPKCRHRNVYIKCPRCQRIFSANDRAGSVTCVDCASEFEISNNYTSAGIHSGAIKKNEVSSPARSRKRSKWVYVMAISFAIGIFYSVNNRVDIVGGGDTNSSVAAGAVDSSWIPSGYSELLPGVALMKIPFGTYSCDGGTSCVEFWAVSKKSCRNGLSVEMNFLDPNGNIVDNGIYNTGALNAGEHVLLTFTSTNEASSNFAFTNSNCFKA